MKSILFTHFKDKLLDRSKQQTFRCIFIPTYEIGEVVDIKFKENNVKTSLFEAKITNIYPKKIRDVTLREAQADGFNSIEDFRKGIMEINKIKSLDRWGFLIKWTDVIYNEEN